MKNKLKAALWKWMIKILRNAIDRADEWVHAQEVELRQESAKQDFHAAVDPAAARVREKAIRRQRTPRPKKPRLVYQHGEFVRLAPSHEGSDI